MAHGLEGNLGAVDHGHPGVEQALGDGVVARAGEAVDHQKRLTVAFGHGLGHLDEVWNVDEGVADLELEQADGAVRVAHQVVEAIAEDADEIAGQGPGGVDWIDRRETVGQGRFELGRGRLGKCCKGHALVLGQVDQQLAQAAGIEQPGKAARPGALGLGQHQGAGHEFVQGTGAMDPVAVEHRLIGGVVPGDGPRVGGGQAGALLGAGDLEHHHGHVARPGLLQRRDEGGRVAHGLDEQGDDLGGRLVEGEVHVVADASVVLLTRRNHHIEAIARVVVGQHHEHRTGMADQGDTAGRAIWRRLERDVAIGAEVVVAHAVAAEHRHTGGPGLGPQALGQFGLDIAFHIDGGEEDRGPGAAGDGIIQRRFEAFGPDTQHRQIGRRGQRCHGASARHPVDLVVLRVDRPDIAGEAAVAQHLDHIVADAAGARRCANQGN